MEVREMSALIPIVGPAFATFFATIAALLLPWPDIGPFLAAFFNLLAAL
jgi:hypothetical protein